MALAEKLNDFVGDEEAAELTALDKLQRDLLKGVGALKVREARYLVDLYYQAQRLRITMASQARSATEAAEPHGLVQFFEAQFTAVESQIRRALAAWVEQFEESRWALSVCGVGPVLAAGLKAHIDITRATSPSKIWSYFGLAPGVVWAKGQKRPWNAAGKVLCIRPDRRVTTLRGYIPISDVRVGDRVLTHKGRFRAVTEVIVNQHDGPLVGLSLFGRGNQVAWVTPEHPVYSKPQPICEWYDHERGVFRWRLLRYSEMKFSDGDLDQMRQARAAGVTLREIAAQFGCSPGYVSLVAKGKVRAVPRPVPAEPGWWNADSISAGWLGCAPRPQPMTKDVVFFLDRTDMVIEGDTMRAAGMVPGEPHPCAHTVPVSVLVDEKVARFFGLYLAEGHVSGCHVGFSFHRLETEYQEFVGAVLRDVFNLPSGLSTHDNCTQVIASSKALANSLRATFGNGSTSTRRGCYAIQPPQEWLIHLGDRELAQLIRGLFEGDGSFKQSWGQLGIVSEQLARFALDALARLGISAGLSTYEREEREPVFRVMVHDRAKFEEMIMGMEAVDAPPMAALKEVTDEGLWFGFERPQETPYIGAVYNLEVEEDHSYVVEGLAVHNCYKIGESFIRSKHREQDFYGKLYDQRKEYERGRNDRGELADQAAESIGRFRKETVAYAAYAQGRLPDARIHARARRWTVKLFLCHYWQVSAEIYGVSPGAGPYVKDHLHHVDMIPAPNWPMEAANPKPKARAKPRAVEPATF